VGTFLVLATLSVLSFWIGYDIGRTSQREDNPPAVLFPREQAPTRRANPRVRPVPSVAAPRANGSRRLLGVIRPTATTKWQERGWTIHGGNLLGNYQGPRGTYPGRIEGYANRHPQFFIRNPPKSLSRHQHSACFMRRGSGWRFVHFGKKPRDPDSGILSIERILHEIS
jgi:hypothetical protein